MARPGSATSRLIEPRRANGQTLLRPRPGSATSRLIEPQRANRQTLLRPKRATPRARGGPSERGSEIVVNPLQISAIVALRATTNRAQMFRTEVSCRAYLPRLGNTKFAARDRTRNSGFNAENRGPRDRYSRFARPKRPASAPNLREDEISTKSASGWWAGRDSNPQPDRYERPALTIELPARSQGGRDPH